MLEVAVAVVQPITEGAPAYIAQVPLGGDFFGEGIEKASDLGCAML
jgi:hypothetical protein